MPEPTTDLINLDAIKACARQLQPFVMRTPVISTAAPVIQQLLEVETISLKLELFQHTGTFKARGALAVAQAIPEHKRAAGITAASAGNHAIAAAWAARVLSMSAKVVMQSNANPLRVTMAKAQGAEIIMKAPGAETFAEAERLVQDEGRTFIHPFDGPYTSLGAAGVGLEFIEELPDLEAVVVSVGGGGLISGVAAAIKAINPKCKIYGVEPSGADSMSKSFAQQAPVTLDKVATIADSLGPPMSLPFSYALCQRHVDQLVTVTDDAICAAMLLLQQSAKLALEPAGATALAGALGPLRSKLAGKKIGIVICGANIDQQSYASLLARGYQHREIFGVKI
ncbi:MAG: pyridoxal-phosphate dependent enzyme [Pseudomonadales bacterium]|nr:pyridoxal-phosphate dependent enzyme [Pseudomonadales bacterium]NRA18007.1 pyridoxal-phosphate dependent enzyme [Oceanospirillaceae bacterium]